MLSRRARDVCVGYKVPKMPGCQGGLRDGRRDELSSRGAVGVREEGKIDEGARKYSILSHALSASPTLPLALKSGGKGPCGSVSVTQTDRRCSASVTCSL